MGTRIRAMLALLLLSSCQGPRPEVQEVKAIPDALDPTHQWIEVAVRNRSGGEGEARLTVRLKSAETSYQRSEKVDLKPHEDTRLQFHFPNPGAGFRPEAEVHYPPD